MNAQIFREGELVAQMVGETFQRVELELEGLPRMTLYGLSRVRLERRFLFEHLQGAPLMRWFNGAGLSLMTLESEPDLIEPVWYVHGRSETMRGNTMVSAVVLAQLHGECKPRSLAVRLPEIYKKFAAAV